jgi:hypothetical protein
MKNKNVRFIVAFAILLSCVAVHFVWPSKENTHITREQVVEYKYVASVNSKPFHYPACRWVKKIYPENLIGFISRQEAQDSGRRPCKVCKP